MDSEADKKRQQLGRHALPCLSEAECDRLRSEIFAAYSRATKQFYSEVAERLKPKPTASSIQRLMQRVLRRKQGMSEPYRNAVCDVLKLSSEFLPIQAGKTGAHPEAASKLFSFSDIKSKIPHRTEGRETHSKHQLHLHCEPFHGAHAFPPDRIVTVAVEVPSGQSRMIKAQLLTFPPVEKPLDIYMRDPSNSWQGQKSAFFLKTDNDIRRIPLGKQPIPAEKKTQEGGVKIPLQRGQNHVLILAAYLRSLLEPNDDSLYNPHTSERRTEFVIRVSPFTSQKPIVSIFAVVTPYTVKISELFEFALENGELCFFQKDSTDAHKSNESLIELSELLAKIVADARAITQKDGTSSVIGKDDFMIDGFGPAFDVLINRGFLGGSNLCCTGDQIVTSNNLFYIISGER